MCSDGRVYTDAWDELTLDQRKIYERGQNQESYEAALEEYNAQIPLAPSVSRLSDDDEDEYDVEDGNYAYRRAIQRWNRYRQDHHKEPLEKSAQGSEGVFPFLRLPFDIRRMVYAVLFKRSRPIIQLDSNGSGKYPGAPIKLGLAVASKQLFAEVMTSLFADNVIYLDIVPNIVPIWSFGLPILFDPKAASAPFWPLKGIKRIQLDVQYGQKEHSNCVYAELEKLVEVLQHCQMAEIEIRAYCRKSYEFEGLPEHHDRDLDESFDKVLARMEALRGVKRMIFEHDLGDGWGRGPGSEEYRIVGTKEYQERLQGLVTRPSSIANDSR
ncbi:MAG: hypothetical protein Q9220_003893 [cf. Caloplaca sp. 1 TL-2023]